jgi:hypothetical protein
LKVKEWENMYHESRKYKKAGMDILILYKLRLKEYYRLGMVAHSYNPRYLRGGD